MTTRLSLLSPDIVLVDTLDDVAYYLDLTEALDKDFPGRTMSGAVLLGQSSDAEDLTVGGFSVNEETFKNRRDTTVAVGKGFVFEINPPMPVGDHKIKVAVTLSDGQKPTASFLVRVRDSLA